eukprot:177397_1
MADKTTKSVLRNRKSHSNTSDNTNDHEELKQVEMQPTQQPSQTFSNTNNIESPTVIELHNDPSESEIPSKISNETLISLMIVYFSVFLDTMGVSIVQPVLPFYAELFALNSTQLGGLYSSYSAMAFIATYCMGKVSDWFGRRPVTIFSLFGTCSGFLATGLSQNYNQLLAARFFTGAFGGTGPVAQAYVTDVVPNDKRPKFLAGIGAVMCIAFVIGPGIGAGLKELGGIATPFFASSLMGFIGVIFAFFGLKESNPKIIAKKHAKIFMQNYIQKHQNIGSKKTQLKSAETEDEEEELNALTTDDEQLDDIQSNDNVNVIIRNVSNSVKSDDSIQQNKNEKIAIQVWLISLIFFLDTMGWCVYMTMFALYLIEVYDITDALVIGYITLALASVYVFANVVAFTFLANRIGIYCTSTIGLFLFSISMAIAPLMPGLWSLLAVVVFGWGLGNGLVFPAMSSMGADYATQKTRGMVLGIVNMGQNLGLIIGPMMHGALYAINVDYMYYVSAGFIFSAFLIQLFMVLYWKETRISLNEMREEKRKSELVVDPKTWKYKKEKIKYKDYVKLGKGFGILLQQRNYQWVTYFDKLFEILDGYFPHLSADNWDRYYNDITFVKQHALETKHDWTTSRLGPNRLYM